MTHSMDVSESDEVSSNISENKEVLDLVIVCDSIGRHLDLNRIYPQVNNKLVCLRGGKINDVKLAVEELHASFSIKCLVLHVGINHTPEEKPLHVANQLLSLIANVKRILPSTMIFYSAMLPKHNSSWLRGINLINETVFNATNVLGFVGIPHPAFAQRGIINESLFCWDAIHLNFKGVAQFAKDIKYF